MNNWYEEYSSWAKRQLIETKKKSIYSINNQKRFKYKTTKNTYKWKAKKVIYCSDKIAIVKSFLSLNFGNNRFTCVFRSKAVERASDCTAGRRSTLQPLNWRWGTIYTLNFFYRLSVLLESRCLTLCEHIRFWNAPQPSVTSFFYLKMWLQIIFLPGV